jgi:hypothetical protein
MDFMMAALAPHTAHAAPESVHVAVSVEWVRAATLMGYDPDTGDGRLRLDNLLAGGKR